MRDSWCRQRRVVGKVEWTGGAAVTSLSPEDAAPQQLYEEIYCVRGDMENRIKECQLDLFADRTSAATMRANQLRLCSASMAYVLLGALRRLALQQTQFAKATCGTIRLKLKIGALVRVRVRRITFTMASGYLYQRDFARADAQLLLALRRADETEQANNHIRRRQSTTPLRRSGLAEVARLHRHNARV